MQAISQLLHAQQCWGKVVELNADTRGYEVTFMLVSPLLSVLHPAGGHLGCDPV